MDLDVVVVGAGVVGLATGAALARAGRAVVVVERREAVGRETTSRNSGVIHAGIYYPANSFKARLCVEGRELLYARCRRLGIPHRETGKYIVACSPEEVPVLETLLERGTANGVPDLRLIDGKELREREPDVSALAGLWSPRTGIVDAAALCLSFVAELESLGGDCVLHTELESIESIAGGFRVRTRDAGGEVASLATTAVVNAAGLGADVVAARAGFDVDACGYRLHPCKGDYFSLAPGAPVALRHLIYPVPGKAGLGVHATLDLGDRILLGPDAEYVEAASYAVDATKADRFAESARRFLPSLKVEWLIPEMAGIRPKLAAEGEEFRDFVIREESAAGHPGFVNLIGIESPGLTAAPAIARQVVEFLV